MIVVPQFCSLRVNGYGLFPGAASNHVIELSFENGLTVIAGINGLGKTTLLNMLLRLISGPFDITASGPPEGYEAILPDEPKKLRRDVLDYFSQRVSDGAKDATAELTLRFGEQNICITRNLANLQLVNFVAPCELEFDCSDSVAAEQKYQDIITDYFNLSTFVDVLLMLHNLIFFTEKKAGALWDANAQRHVLQAIVLDKKLSRKFSDATRAVQTADSQFRNTRAQHGKFQRQLNELSIKEEMSPQTKARLDATIEAIEGSSEKLEVLEAGLYEVGDTHRLKRLELEKAKLENESANGAVERAKYTSLLHSFPKMDDAARLLLSRILSEAECLVCGAEAEGKKLELEALLLDGYCPACGSDPENQAYQHDQNEFEQVKMTKARKTAQTASKELDKASKAFFDIDQERAKKLENVIAYRKELEGLRSSQEQLEAMLPADSKRVQGLRQMVDGFKITLDHETATLQAASDNYSNLLKSVTKQIVDVASQLSDEFKGYIDNLISETASLVTTDGKAKIGQERSSTFNFPVFVPEMSAADRPGLTPRQSPDDVSESQRELIDLAFRLALLEVATKDGEATFVMETPEASLDGLAMERVGQTLKIFSETDSKRLVITNNLTNAGMVTSIFGGSIQSKMERAKRFKSVFNLLIEAAPNQSLEDNRKEYTELLEEAITGVRA